MEKLPQESQENKSERQMVRATQVIAAATVLLVILAFFALL